MPFFGGGQAIQSSQVISGFDHTYSADVTSPDVFADLGSPGTAKLFKIAVAEGVVINSANTTDYSFDLLGFPAGSTFLIQAFGTGNSRGRLQPPGGAGGRGAGSSAGKAPGAGGGGGGGAGAIGGAGGNGLVNNSGDPGTETDGGAGGGPVLQGGVSNRTSQNGSDGGNALRTRGFAVELVDLAVWAGGGGGGGGAGSIVTAGGDGGDPGENGSDSQGTGGSRGIAIRQDSGPAVTETGGTDIRGRILTT